MPVTFLSAYWRNLIMANYIVDPALLHPYLPAGTELDHYDGNTYVSLVGFMFEQTKLLGIPVPLHRNFEEVNLRFYVRYNDKGKWKRGVVFIKEIVPKHAITFVANTIYHEKYQTMPMRHSITNTQDEMQLEYEWQCSGIWNHVMVVTGKQALPMITGSEAYFIAEHYWGYSRYNESVTYEYEVKHPEWQIYPVRRYSIDCDFKKVYGDGFGFLSDTHPSSVFVAAGSAIRVMGKRKIG
ncbi:MAG: DUF2071 domain-containing protein [Bacteroidetes bacterium]|nr:DUF2071 domain-containing protein [Bacteroidota bacterium]